MQMMQMMWPGAIAVQAIHVAAKLGLADLVAAGAKSAEELAEATQTQASALARFLRALTSLGIFTVDQQGRYEQNALSDTLRPGSPHSMHRWAMMLGARFVWEPTGALDTAIRAGRPSFEQLYGKPFFRYLAEHPDDGAVFNAAMSSMPAFIAATVNGYDFARFERIVDVGGGHGTLLLAILAANPRVRGALQDLPEVVSGVPPAQMESVRDRLEIVAGDFFESVHPGADGYVLKGIVHDWNDESAVRILKNCRRAIRPDGRLLLLEMVLTGNDDPGNALMDLLMMVLTGGRERTEAEFRSLLHEAGFSLERIIPAGGASILESRPV